MDLYGPDHREEEIEVNGVLAMSRVRGSLLAAKLQTLLRSSGGSFLKMVNIFSFVAIVGQWAE